MANLIITITRLIETVIYDADLYYISPVLVAGATEKWTGEYEGDKMRFSVKDKDF